MTTTLNIIYQHLREKVEQKLERNIRYNGDCIILSEILNKKFDRRISVTTIKRFWGLVNSRFNPSVFTLDSLAFFCGYVDFNDFQNKESLIPSEIVLPADYLMWEKTAEAAKEVTEHTVSIIKNKSSIPYEKCIQRSFIFEQFNDFLQSECTALAITAPAGCGKSITILQIAEHFFYGNNAIYSHDIFWLLDGNSINSIRYKDFNPGNFFMQLMGYVTANTKYILTSKKQNTSPRTIVVIDGLNDAYDSNETLYLFLDSLLKIIYANASNQNLKIVITCRKCVWDYILSQINTSYEIDKLWYLKKDKGICLPPFSNAEVNNVLKNSNQENYLNIQFKYRELSSLIKIPYFLSIFLLLHEKKKRVSEVTMFSEYTKNFILSAPFAEAKYKFLNSFIKSTYCVENKHDKNFIEQEFQKYYNGYKNLISNGVLEETKELDKYLHLKTKLRFIYNRIHKFMLINYLLRENGLNNETLEKVANEYSQDQNIQTDLIKWIIRFAFSEKNFDILLNFFDFMDTKLAPVLEKKYCIQLIHTIVLELNHYPEYRKILVNHYAQTLAGQKYYFEKIADLDFLVLHSASDFSYYLQYNNSTKCTVLGLGVQIFRDFVTCNWDSFDKNYGQLTNISLNTELPFFYEILILGSEILSQFHENEKISISLQNKIIQKASESHKKNPILFYTIIIDTLNMCDEFQLIILLFDFWLANKNEEIEKKNDLKLTIWYFYIRALINTMQHSKVLEIYSAIQQSVQKQINFHYEKLKSFLVKAELLIFLSDKTGAISLLKKAQELAEFLDFKFYQFKVSELLRRISV